MASKIRVLDEQTINKIAAGEVIENPASVVKELVENSLDAGARDICIEIKGGGRQMIRITDDGCGMNADDALLCLERHATSKIRTVEELLTLNTMGFRGEAIPSIASISKFMLVTSPSQSELQTKYEGTMVLVDGGKIISCAPAARSQGTTIEVKSLFFNVPVRKKFLKSPAYDANEILKTVSLMALGNPEIKFQLINDEKKQLTAPQTNVEALEEKFKTRIGHVLGQDFIQNTAFIESKHEALAIHGLVGLPSYTRHNRTGQYLFINGRPVTSPAIAFAVKEGYGTSLAPGRHPVFVLYLSMPGHLVDVNVHPQKREVRLRQEQAIKELISKAIAKVLESHSINAKFSPAFDEISFANFFQSDDTSSLEKKEWIFQPREPFPPHEFSPDPILPTVNSPLNYSPPHLDLELGPKNAPSPSLFPTHEKSSHPPKVLATVSRYILLDGEIQHEFFGNRNGLILIDQKAAHARIIFEKLLQTQVGTSISQQMLLIPEPIEVSPFEAEALRISLPFFNQMGIHLQEFGQNSFLLDAVPQIFGNINIRSLILSILHDLSELHNVNLIHQEKIKKIALAASRAAISYDRKLTLEEAQGLINQLVLCQQPYHCPVGKPILAHLSPENLLKLFHK